MRVVDVALPLQYSCNAFLQRQGAVSLERHAKSMPVRLTLRCIACLNHRSTLFSIVILDLIHGAGAQVQLNLKVRDLRGIPDSASNLKKF
jgi:hypothetical protein